MLMVRARFIPPGQKMRNNLRKTAPTARAIVLPHAANVPMIPSTAAAAPIATALSFKNSQAPFDIP
jgi:hypothetical protein